MTIHLLIHKDMINGSQFRLYCEIYNKSPRHIHSLIMSETFNNPIDVTISNIDRLLIKIKAEIDTCSYQRVILNDEFIRMLEAFKKMQEFIFLMSTKNITLETSGPIYDSKKIINEYQRLEELRKLASEYTKSIKSAPEILDSAEKKILYVHADRLSSDELIEIIRKQDFSYIAFSSSFAEKANLLEDKILELKKTGLVLKAKIIEASTSAFVTAAHNHQVGDNDLIFMSHTDLEIFKKGFRTDFAEQYFNLEMLFANPNQYISVMSTIANMLLIPRENLDLDEHNIYIKITGDISGSILDILQHFEIIYSSTKDRIAITIKDADQFFKRNNHSDILRELCKFSRQHHINPYNIYVNAGRDEELTTLFEIFGEDITNSFFCSILFEPFSTKNPAYISAETGHSYSLAAINDIWKGHKKDPKTREIWQTKPVENSAFMSIWKNVTTYLLNGESKSSTTNIAFATRMLATISEKLSQNNKDFALKSLSDSFASFIAREKETATAAVREHAMPHSKSIIESRERQAALGDEYAPSRFMIEREQQLQAAADDDDTPSSNNSFRSCVSDTSNADHSSNRGPCR